MDLSIIILSYNTENLTKKCIESIYASLKDTASLDFEIIVLDNASTDQSVTMLRSLRERHKNLHIIESSANTGFSKGNNIASRKAQGKYVLFLNSDIEVVDDSIKNLYTSFVKSTYAFGGCRLLNSDRSPQPSCGKFFTLPVTFDVLFLHGNKHERTRFTPKNQQAVDWVSGACFICKKETFDSLNGFDENIFMYFEEVDLMYRAHKQNLQTGFFPNATMMHHEAASSSSKAAPIIRMFKGFQYFYKKHYSSFDQLLIRYMLQLKAIGVILLATVLSKKDLKETYKAAYETTYMDR